MNTLAALASLAGLVHLASPALAQTPTQTKRLASTGSEGDWYGWSAAVGETFTLVGAPNVAAPSPNGGAVYVLDRHTGEELRRLTPSGTAAGFGRAVDIEGDLAVIGAPSSSQVMIFAGAAFVFDANTGAQLHRFLPNDAATSDFAGSGVAIDGGRALVGVFGKDDFGIDSGAAYLFDPVTGLQLAKYAPADLAAGDHFGAHCDLSGSLALVGAPDQGASGAAYLIDADTGQVLHKWTPAPGAVDTGFGIRVAIDGEFALVGANLENETGAVHVYSTSTGAELFVLSPPAGVTGPAYFGAGLQLDGTRACVSALNVSDAYGEFTGTAFVYDLTNPASAVEVKPVDSTLLDRFGYGVGLRGDTLVVGAPFDDPTGFDSGSVTIFDLSGSTNSGAGSCYGSDAACPCAGVQGPTQGCGNSTGLNGASLAAWGNASLGADTFELQLTGVRGVRPSLLLRGANLLNGGAGNPVGDGLLCTSGQVARSQVQITEANLTTFSDFNGQPFGAASYGAGVPVHYQAWYRDPVGSCSGLRFNFSNVWTVTWQP